MAALNGSNVAPIATSISAQNRGFTGPKSVDQGRRQLAAIVGSSDDAIVSKDLNGVVASWNKAAEAIFGYPADEMVGQPITRIIPPARIGEATEILDRICRGGKVDHFETERQRKDETIIPVSLTISPVHDEHGDVIGISMIARDLRVPQRLHLELRRREALLRSILDTVAEALIQIDGRGLIRSFSTAAERLFGYAAGEVIGQTVNVLMPANHRQERDAYPERYAATGEWHVIGTGRVVIGRRKDGTTFPVELTVSEVNLNEERLFTGVIRDLTERREHDRRFQELQAASIHVSRLNELGLMISALSHEVSQPLSAMTNFISGARRLFVAGNAAGAAQALERIAEQTQRARQIIQRLHDLVRKGGTERRLENLATTIEEASAIALLRVGSGLKCAIQVDDDASEAVIDKIQIQQVLMNLMRNAVEAMASSERRELRITSHRVDDMIEISVADTGPGLPEQVRLRLFEPFVTTRPDGMGMGLSVCRTIIEDHGGRISVGDGDDVGTVFRLTIPSPAAASRR